jgi:SAM-dependent methyltransferase
MRTLLSRTDLKALEKAFEEATLLIRLSDFFLGANQSKHTTEDPCAYAAEVLVLQHLMQLHEITPHPTLPCTFARSFDDSECTRLRNYLREIRISIAPQSDPIGAGQIMASVHENLVRLRGAVRIHNEENGEQAALTQKYGVYYTPATVVDYITDEALNAFLKRDDETALKDNLLRGMRVLDPACGTGVFLYSALVKLQAFCTRAGLATSFAIYSLFGIDRDPVAIWLTRSLLLQSALHLLPRKELERVLAAQIVCAHALFDVQKMLQFPSLPQLPRADCVPESFFKDGFDCIVGNPPYGLSRGARMSAEERDTMKVLFKEGLPDKPNKYMLFILRGIDLLRPEGLLSLVVPNSWLGIRSAAVLRKLLLSKQYLEKITVLNWSVFGGPQVEVVVTTLRKKCVGTRSEVDTDRFRIQSANNETELANPTISFEIPYAECLSRAEYTIPITRAPATFQFMWQAAQFLGDETSPFVSRIALQAYTVGKGEPPQPADFLKTRPFDLKEKVDDSTFPYLEGADVGRYQLRWSGGYLKHGPWLADPQPIARFQGPRIVLREILGVLPYLIQATYLQDTYLYNKSILHILPRSSAAAELLFILLAAINSKFGSAYFLTHGRKTQRRLFPKIVNDDLKNFPLPNFKSIQAKEIIVASGRRLDTATNLAELDSQLDQLVYSLYDLKNSEVLAIEEMVK